MKTRATLFALAMMAGIAHAEATAGPGLRGFLARFAPALSEAEVVAALSADEAESFEKAVADFGTERLAWLHGRMGEPRFTLVDSVRVVAARLAKKYAEGPPRNTLGDTPGGRLSTSIMFGMQAEGAALTPPPERKGLKAFLAEFSDPNALPFERVVAELNARQLATLEDFGHFIVPDHLVAWRIVPGSPLGFQGKGPLFLTTETLGAFADELEAISPMTSRSSESMFSFAYRDKVFSIFRKTRGMRCRDLFRILSKLTQ